jgi:hypothetical protein
LILPPCKKEKKAKRKNGEKETIKAHLLIVTLFISKPAEVIVSISKQTIEK